MVVAIIGILTIIAVPNYSAYVQRSRIIDATSRLGDFRVRMEQYFLDNRTYAGAGGKCGIPDPPVEASMPFAITCAGGARNYIVTATGQPSLNMQSFSYSIDQNGVKRTVKLPNDWTNTDGCWVVRKDGTCI